MEAGYTFPKARKNKNGKLLKEGWRAFRIIIFTVPSVTDTPPIYHMMKLFFFRFLSGPQCTFWSSFLSIFLPNKEHSTFDFSQTTFFLFSSNIVYIWLLRIYCVLRGWLSIFWASKLHLSPSNLRDSFFFFLWKNCNSPSF